MPAWGVSSPQPTQDRRFTLRAGDGVGVECGVQVLGHAGVDRFVGGGEAVVGHVHVGQAGVDLVAALVEPAADELAVLLGQLHGLGAVGGGAGVHQGGEAAAPVLVLLLVAQPVLLGVPGGA